MDKNVCEFVLFFLHTNKQGAIFSNSKRQLQIKKQYYKSLFPLHVVFVANITLLHVTAGFPVRSQIRRGLLALKLAGVL
jgi:hypothetical protein